MRAKGRCQLRLSNLGFVVFAFFMPLAVALYACGSSSGDNADGGPGGGDDSGLFDGVFGETSMGDAGKVDGSFTAPDCPGCMFPPLPAPPCAMGTPAINVVYPNDGVLVPPNMNVISVQWTPFGGGFTEFEVDFENNATDMRVITKCATQTVDTGQPPMPSGGCELLLDPTMWAFVSNANRGGDPVTVTVRGTTNGMCASTSANSIAMSFANEDVLGGIYYWKSTITTNGVGGQIWVKSFGDSNPEQLVTTSLMATCNGCHSLSRDGARMVINADDDDSDDEYNDVRGALIDMATKMTVGNTGQPPGFSTFSPDHLHYLTSNGRAAPPTNDFGLFDGVTGQLVSTPTFGGGNDRPTMPDWSPDGRTVVYVKPTQVGSWNGKNDDDHVFGGSIWTLPYMGNQMFGTPAPLLVSAGENNYYPSYSPDGNFIMFDRAPHDTSVGALDGCNGTAPQRACPNDSFSNPAARLMLLPNTQGAFPVDLEAANGSPAAQPVQLSNSWPRWSPFLQTYKGNKLLWIAYSSTRDYGLRVRNHKTGMYQCYPADSFEDPGSAHRQPFVAACQQPQLWMAAINLSEASVHGKDPSRVAFWLPFQDIKTHNHTPQWTQQVITKPPMDGGACVPSMGDCRTNPGGCCGGLSCGADGKCHPVIP